MASYQPLPATVIHRYGTIASDLKDHARPEPEMKDSLQQSTIWLRAAMVAGFVLGLLLLVETVFTYLFVSHRLIEEEAQREANRIYSSVIESARNANVTDLNRYGQFLDQERSREPNQVAWIRLSTVEGKVIAQSGDPGAQRLPPVRDIETKANHREPAVYRQTSIVGPVLIVGSRLRVLRDRPNGLREDPGFRGRGFPNPGAPHAGAILEIAIYLDRVSLTFGLLQHNLIIGCLASLALLASILTIALLLRRYARARELEQQLQLAEGVQRDLLPHRDFVSASASQFAAVSIPAAIVGGDFHDVLPGDNGNLSLLVGDVSGKGLSAALLMGVIHGAVRSTDWTSSALHHEVATERLNRLLCEKTAHERFASLFWCCFEPETGTLRYINAGHLPPLLVRAGSTSLSLERLCDGGGPVLGLLPSARFVPCEVVIQAGDLLVIYSDGILEATNANDEEFGEERIFQTVKQTSVEDPARICDAVLIAIERFLGPLKPHDDQTLMVVRLIPAGSSIHFAPQLENELKG